MDPLDFRSLWEEALPWSSFYTSGMDQWKLWEGVYRHVTVPEAAVVAARRIPGLRLLAITEDWCGDAANTIPVLQRLSEAVPGLDLRILPRDQYPEAMARYLTDGSKSIPIVIGLDRDFRELGHWGPRPAELQAWVMAHKATMPKDERYLEVRRWYARDKGVTTLNEVLGAIGTKPEAD